MKNVKSVLVGKVRNIYERNIVMDLSAILSFILLTFACSMYANKVGAVEALVLRDTITEAVSCGLKGLFVLLAYVAFLRRHHSMQKAYLGALVGISGLSDFAWAFALPGRIGAQPVFYTIVDILFCILSLAIFACFFLLIIDDQVHSNALVVMHGSVVGIVVIGIISVIVDLIAGLPVAALAAIGGIFAYIFMISICTKLDTFKYVAITEAAKAEATEPEAPEAAEPVENIEVQPE